MVAVSINGFGRIGRLVTRAIAENKKDSIEITSINDLGGTAMAAHLLQYDSVHGRFPTEVTHGDDWIDFGLGKIKFTAERDPASIDHSGFGTQIVHECTGIFTSKETASAHLAGGAKKVLVSAPATDADLTVVYGVNHHELTADHTVVSNASCTTNCLAPVVKVLDDLVGIEKGQMLTVHSYTGDQRVVDTAHSDPRRARAAAMNMIPTSTGAARAIGLVLPHLKGKLDGYAIRVPTPNVSVVDFTFVAKRDTTVEEINNALKSASAGALKGVLGFSALPLVSSDFIGDTNSSIVDADQTQVNDGNLVHVTSWYDNEAGFSNRMGDTTLELAKFL